MVRRVLIGLLPGVLVPGLVTLGGCARGISQVRAVAAPTEISPAIVATGVWDWMFRATDDQGDVRLEQEEWHLQQNGRVLGGYYDRAVTLMSTDERLFRCNQQLAFTKFTRVRIAGTVQGDRVVLQEVGFEAKPGPCDDGARNLVQYVGVLRGATLRLSWERGGGQTLHRREEGQTGELAVQFRGISTRPVAALGASPVVAEAQASLPVAGDWGWELRSIDAEGDERTEREEWHLAETIDGIHGDYVRTVVRVRGEGLFTCNGSDRFETVTRYAIKGMRQGERIMLTETDYTTAPTPCDNGMRRLDTYYGGLSPDGEDLVLSWGPGNQLLHRKR